jgi:hypothetical protein
VLLSCSSMSEEADTEQVGLCSQEGGCLFDPQPGSSLLDLGSLALWQARPTGARAKSRSCRKSKPGAVTSVPQPHGAAHASSLPRQYPSSSSTLHPAARTCFSLDSTPDRGLSIGSRKQILPPTLQHCPAKGHDDARALVTPSVFGIVRGGLRDGCSVSISSHGILSRSGQTAVFAIAISRLGSWLSVPTLAASPPMASLSSLAVESRHRRCEPRIRHQGLFDGVKLTLCLTLPEDSSNWGCLERTSGAVPEFWSPKKGHHGNGIGRGAAWNPGRPYSARAGPVPPLPPHNPIRDCTASFVSSFMHGPRHQHPTSSGRGPQP